VCVCHAAVTPPGYKTANGVTVPCEAGAYRSGWTAPGLATSCVSCGVGVFADKTDRIIQYNLVTNQVEFVAVTTEPDDCCKCCCWVGIWPCFYSHFFDR
jgi:hypothetical protein